MANQEVVGVLRAILAADTAQFDASMKRSAQTVTAFGQETTKAAAGIAKSLSGQQIIAQAKNTVEALRLIEGHTKLTRAEAAKLTPVFTEAIDKLKAMGVAVPASFTQAQASLKAVGVEGAKTSKVFEGMKAHVASIAAGFTTGLLFDRAISGIVSLGKEAIASAGRIKDLSLQLGVSTDFIQGVTFAAEQSGATFEDVAQSVTQMNNRLADGDKSTVAALQSVGLELRDLRSMKPEDAFLAISDAIAGINDPMQQTQVAMDLFGKGGARILAMIKDGMAENIANAPKLTESMIEGLDKAEDAWREFYQRLVVLTGGAIATIAEQWDHIKDFAELMRFLNNPAGYAFGKVGGAAVGFIGGGLGDQSTLPGSIPGKIEPGTSVLKWAAKPNEFAKKVSDALKEIDAALAQNAKSADKSAKAVDILEKEYQDYVQMMSRFLPDAQHRQMANEERYAKTLGLGNDALRIRLSLADTWLQIQQHAAGISLDRQNPPPAMLTIGDTSGRSLLNRGPQIDPRALIPPPVENTRQLVMSLGLIDGALAQLGQTADEDARAIIEFGRTFLRVVEMVAQGASEAQVAMAGIGMVIGVAIMAWQDHDAYVKAQRDTIRRLRGDIADLGATVSQVGGPLTMQIARLMGQLVAAEHAAHRLDRAIDGLRGPLARFGGAAPAALRPLINQLLLSNRLTEEQRAQLEALAEGPSVQTLTEAAERWSLAIDQLGAGFEQLRLNEFFDQANSDWTMFRDLGTDANYVISLMGPRINEALARARQFGLHIPEYMRPILQAMMAAGQLTDEFGNKLETLSGFTFDDSILSSLDKIREGLDHVVAALVALGDTFLEALGYVRKTAGDLRGGLNPRNPLNPEEGGVRPGLGSGARQPPLLGGLGVRMPGVHDLGSSFDGYAGVDVGASTIVVQAPPVYLDGRLITSSVAKHNPSVMRAYGQPS